MSPRDYLRSAIAIPASMRTKRTRAKPLAPLRAVQKVEQSWSIISSDLEALGIDFFIRVFLDVPDALDLFLSVLQMDEEEMNAIKSSHVAILHFVKENKMIKAHARLVIMEMGRCVAGLYDITVLVPRLRSLGRMHGAAGVKPEHYDIFFKHLMAAIKDRIISSEENTNGGDGDAGNDACMWDASTEEAWCTVRDCMHRILSKPDDAVGCLDGGGSLNRWSAICATASLYACIVTPLRMAGMIGYTNIMGGRFSFWRWMLSFHALGFWEMLNGFGFALLDSTVAVVFIVELVACVLLRFTRVQDLRKVRNISSRKFQRATPLGKGIIVLRMLGIQESVTFPISDVIFLLSYVIQYQNMTWYGTVVGDIDMDISCAQHAHDGMYMNTVYNNATIHDSDCTTSTSQATNLITVGVHWTWGFGILRLVTILRTVYAMKRIELSYTINNRADGFTRLVLRISRLLVGMTYTSHVAACLYVLVARIGLGPNAYYDAQRPEALATAFFPDYTILGKENGMLTNYLRCVHFAFTNLAGIGNHESHPYSALECMFTLTVNALGATLYAFTTGLLLSIIEPAAARANQFGDSAAALTEFMTEVGMTVEEQDRIIQGFVMREMSGKSAAISAGDTTGPFAPAPGQNCTAPAYPEQLVNNLPRYLQDELHTMALVDAMKRRERAFRRCNNEFLAALASSLKQCATLLPGDFIVREGQANPTQLMIVEHGSLEVVVDGNYIRTFERGDMISFHWVENTRGSSILSSSRQLPSSGSFSPLLLSDSVAGASVRAMNHCKIATGLTMKSEKKEIRTKYPSDWRELEEVLDQAKGKRRKSKKDDDTVPTSSSFNDDTNDDGSVLGVSQGSRKSRNSLTKRIRRFSIMPHHHHDANKKLTY